MKYYAHAESEPNFGDELNHFLLPKILPDFFDEVEDPLFLGIGSILFDFHPKNVRKLVFGSGYGGYTAKPSIDESWTFYGVRGPRTAAALGLSPDLVIADLAVMLYEERSVAPTKRYRASFIPHFQSLGRGNWARVAEDAGVHFIDPRRPVWEILQEIEASEVVVAEAMHGAIAADALRVPWVALLPFDQAHRFKWYDWAEALGVDLRPVPLPASSLYEWADNVRIAGKTLRRATQPTERHLRTIGADWFQARAAVGLRAAAKAAPQMSTDIQMRRAVERFREKIDLVRRERR